MRRLIELMKIFVGMVFSWFVALTTMAQSPAGAPLQARVQVSFHGYLLPEGAYVPAPVDMFIHPVLEPSIPMHPGDTVAVDFFGDGKKLCSAKAVWHNASFNKGTGQPLPAQFLVPNCIWTNISQGSHVVTIQAHGLQGLSTSTGPMHFTVLPPLPPQPPVGTHMLTGKKRPPTESEAVKVFRMAPKATYEVVGSVTARAQATQPKSVQDAIAEIRKQAALLGANGVIIDKASHSDGVPFGGPNKTFALPEIRMAGRAIYVLSTQ